MKELESSNKEEIASWATGQRELIERMNGLPEAFLEKYCDENGEFHWVKEWPGMDGSDDGYEGFLTWPMFYLIGGHKKFDKLGRQQWEAVTNQFTKYGQIHDEYDAYYDWLHHGESSTYLYYLGMSDPNNKKDRERAIRFADFYVDPKYGNWDAELKQMKSPINGSKGAQSSMSAEDWCTHREVLKDYLAPFEDIPGYELDDPEINLDWEDDTIFAAILKTMNERMVPGDIPMNLVATSLVSNAYLYTGEEKYKQWVLDYLETWTKKTEENDGILPDNIGPTGKIGELMDGKWWGGYYGWHWPHGALNQMESTLIAGCNAMMLDQDESHLDLYRSVADMMWSNRKEVDGEQLVPYKKGDKGWFTYRKMDPFYHIQCWYMTQDESDKEKLLEQNPGVLQTLNGANFGKAGSYAGNNWLAFITGNNEDYAEQVIAHTHQGIDHRLALCDKDDIADCESWDVHHWQNRDPILPTPLIQMAMGTCGEVYHGGLLYAAVSYFNPEESRAGLTSDMAAFVTKFNATEIDLTLVNTNESETHEQIIQAGSFGEHQFLSVELDGQSSDIDDARMLVKLAAGCTAHLKITYKRYQNKPSYYSL
ncbi:MAG: hypothetical protein HRT89_05520 [Lentisphaeria bacterium]|nr:hypothetical protein [Lentisphaeria bacterium]NQZ67510.1 hypothetical protein [Lentisphaeria bacterium]